MRIACLLVPDLPLHAELRASPELQGFPLAITNGPGSRAEILSISHEAFSQGVRVGQTLPQARTVCPRIEARTASPVLMKAAREAMLDVGLSMAPRAELAEPSSGLFLSEGAVYVDASGTQALYGSEGTLASILHARAERAGIRGVVAIASSRSMTRLVARHLAHGLHSATAPTEILSPEAELAFLAPLPIDLLDPDDRTAQALTRFGIHCIQDLLRLSRRDLAARLGPGLLSLVAKARGEESELPLAEPRITSLEEAIDLEAPIGNLEPLAFICRGLLSRLIERLTLRALGCIELRLALQLENGALESRRIGVASPSQDERVLLRLLRLAVESKPPPAAIDRVTLICEGVALRLEQLDLFLPRGPSANELDQTLAELSAICGAERVGSPEVVDDHRPDAFALKPFAKRKPRSKTQTRSHQAPPSPRRGLHLALRALRPPLRAEVRLERGRPVFARSTMSQGRILESAGPWRTTGHWWSKASHFATDHYDVQMSDGNILRLCFDWRMKRWVIDGLYD
ncbi:MAG TPA: DNA polymerase Y family protein [Myxococcales bacterium]|nr:DNA polymerase Y family protein [Myxococcales bacterium]HIK84384.1 DNA polymerase Y family protein [Myxococcales bacterium]